MRGPTRNIDKGLCVLRLFENTLSSEGLTKGIWAHMGGGSGASNVKREKREPTPPHPTNGGHVLRKREKEKGRRVLGNHYIIYIGIREEKEGGLITNDLEQQPSLWQNLHFLSFYISIYLSIYLSIYIYQTKVQHYGQISSH